MKYEKSIQAMHKAGRVRATCHNLGQVRIAERYLERAILACHDENPPFHLTQAAYQDGLKGNYWNKYKGMAQCLQLMTI